MTSKSTRHGGARIGAGRKRRPLNVPATSDPLRFLAGVMRDEHAPTALRVRAAMTLLRLEPRSRVRPAGKKALAQAAAGVAGQGRFAPTPTPKVVPFKKRDA
jgi:hypothetical protein